MIAPTIAMHGHGPAQWGRKHSSRASRRALCLALLGALAMTAATAAIYTPVHDIDTYNYGFEKKESFDVAIHISDPNLSGAKIVGIRVPIDPEAQVTTAGYTLWLSTALTVKANSFTPDIAKATATIANGWAEATFDQPYTVADGEVYAGYSFAIKAVETDADRRPLVLANAEFGKNNMWLHTSHTYRSWQNFGESVNTSSPIQVIIDDSSLQPTAASAKCDAVVYLEKDKAATYRLNIENHGNTPISHIAYTYNIGEASYTGEAALDQPIGCQYYGESQCLDIEMPAIGQCATLQGQVAVNKVNGADNLDRTNPADITVTVLPFIAKRRPMVEEYTGLWCGYCPTGYVGLKLLAEHIGDDVVIVSIHNNDPMEVLAKDKYAHAIEGYPDLWFDRTASTDPFFGENLNNMYGLDNLWLRHSQQLAMCDIDLEASYNESQSRVAAYATVRFLNDMDAAPYRVGFYLTADDLSSPSWVQTNYYSTGNQLMPIEMTEFTKGEMYVTGLHFDDVLVAYSDVKGIRGSLPASIKSGEVYSVDHTFNISGNTVIQDKKKVKAIAYVVNSETGQIENAICTPLYRDDAGIAAPEAEGQVVSTEYYDLQGIRVTEPMHGLYIKVDRYSNGAIKATKQAISR